MNYSSHFGLFVCSISVVVIAFALPFITARLPESERKKTPIWTVVAGLTLAIYSGLQLRAIIPGYDRFFYSFILTSVMLSGVFVKWLMESISQKKLLLHESVLFGSLLLAPLLNVVGQKFLPSIPTFAVCLLWFFNGYFWHALLNDIKRLFVRESLLIRRREPSVSYDLRKPETAS